MLLRAGIKAASGTILFSKNLQVNRLVKVFLSGREPCLEHSERCGVMEDPGFSSEAQGWCC